MPVLESSAKARQVAEASVLKNNIAYGQLTPIAARFFEPHRAWLEQRACRL